MLRLLLNKHSYIKNLSSFVPPVYVSWALPLSFHHAMPCLQVKRLLRRRSYQEVAVSHRAQPPSAQCRKVDFGQPSKRCEERQPVSGPSRSQITARVSRKFSLMLCCGVLAAQAPHGYFDVHHQQGTCVQSSVVCTQSVTSAATICSNVWGPWMADQGPGKGAADNQQDEHQE